MRRTTLDPRRNAFRADLADERLTGAVEAERFVAGERHQVVRPTVPLRRSPQFTCGFDTEALLGEKVLVFDRGQGWAWVQLERDGYVGYVPSDSLAAEIVEPTHRVRSMGTFLYRAPDMKGPPILHLSLNAEVTVVEWGEKYSRIHSGAYVFSRHLTEIGRGARDFVDVAEQLIETPYLWGGKTRIGLDCSGLVQVALHAAGLGCPRDSDMQLTELGEAVLMPKTLEGLARGDLVFWPGHVGIMTDGIMLLHANAHHMTTVSEPLPEAVERISRTGSAIAGVKRLPALGT